MGTILTSHWLAGVAELIAIRDDASVSQAREAVRAKSDDIGLASQARERMASAVSELARNQLVHVGTGVVGLRAITRDGIAGLEVIAADSGPGIADPSAAYHSGRVTGSLGVGLAAAHRQVDELDVDVRLGEGTCVRARAFVTSVPKLELAILGRPHPDERISGDHAAVVHDDGGCTIGIVDGLGHGVAAREAANAAIGELLRHAQAPGPALASVHAALTNTRGAVMTVARVAAGRTIAHASVGNVATRMIGSDGRARALASTPGVLGTSSFPRRVVASSVALAAHEIMVIFTDGITSRVELVDEPSIVRQPGITIAHYILSHYGRTTDDGLVAVIR